MLEFENVSKSFWTGTQRKVILDRVSFRIELGRSVGILAPNGTGKTTLVNMMAGLEKPDEGEIRKSCKILDPEGKIASLRSQINNIEVQLQGKELELAALLDNNRPNRAKVEGAEGDVRRYQALLDRLNSQMTDASQGENSLAELASQIQLAQADVATRDMMLASALEQLEQTRREAASQARYLTTSVEPVPSQDPTYPRKFENTILAFLVFAGLYLMISLTASILREQVSS
jgi:capsular polysaccharide transport system permease protein